VCPARRHLRRRVGGGDVVTPGRLEKFLKRLAPELGGGPLYVYVPKDSEPIPPATESYLGCTGRRMDLTLRPLLSEWRGRGPAIALNTSAIRQEAKGLADGLGWTEAATFGWRCAMTAIHELGHVLADGPPPYFDAVERPPLTFAEVVRHFSAPPSRFARSMPSWWGHSMHSWGRIVLHLRHRAEALGMYCPATVLIDWRRFGLSSPACYVDRLGDEPERMAGATFEDIKATPAPDAFSELWRMDTGPADDD